MAGALALREVPFLVAQVGKAGLQVQGLPLNHLGFGP